MEKLQVIYREETDRWVRGDKFLRPILRRILRRKKPYVSGMQLVVNNFLLGLRRKHIDFRFNASCFALAKSAKVISFGLGMNGVTGLSRSNPVIAAIGFPFPLEAPDLCERFDIRKYLQHSAWAMDLVQSVGVYPNEVFGVWPAGIDTDQWVPMPRPATKQVDVLIYDKIYWDRTETCRTLLQPIKDFLSLNGYSFSEIAYGKYSSASFRAALNSARAMIFLSAHESQGLAYQECMSTNVPVMAWDQGSWLDPVRARYGLKKVRATSVPYFDERCGVRFSDMEEFAARFPGFYERTRSGRFSPRDFVLETLSIERSTAKLLDIYHAL